VLAAALSAALCPALSRAQQRERASRQVPETLNFANGLFRERKFVLAAEQYERFLEDARPGPFADEARFGLASARLFLGQYDKARRQFEEFLKNAPEHPNAPSAWYRIGETAYVLGDLPAARGALETYTKRFQKHRYNDTAWPYLGDVYFRLGDLGPARHAYEKALADFPEGRLANRARLGLGRTLAARGEADAALKVLTDLAAHGGPDWADKAWFQIGQVQATAGRFDQAAAAFATVERDAPESPLVAESRLRRAEALLRLDRFDEAEALLRGLAAGGAENLAAQAALALGTEQLNRSRAAEAFATLDDALRRLPRAPAAPALLFRSAEAKLKQGDAEGARTRFLKLAESEPDDPWADDALLQAARIALEAKDLDGARRLAGSLAERYPKSPLRPAARLIEARAALAADRPKDAITVLAASLEQDKPDPQTAQDLRYSLGQAYQADGQPEKAKEILDALTEAPAAPVAANARFLLGQGHIEAKRFAEAIPPLEKYLSANRDGDVADYALAHLAHAKLEVGDADGAWQALGRLAERFPKSKVLAPTRLRLAGAAFDAKQYDRAAEQFRRAAGSPDPAVRSKAQSGLGWALLEGGKPADAADAFAALLEAAPDDPLAPDAAFARARALEKAGRADQALDAYAHAAEKYPKFNRLDALLSGWGWALIDADKTADADGVFSRLLREFPDSPHAADARFNLAESAHKAGRHDDVVKLLTPLVAEGPKASPSLVEPALYRLGRTQFDLKDWRASAKTLDRFLADFPQSRYRREARYLRAEAALQSDDPEAAERGFAALAAEPHAAGDPDGFALAVRRERIQSLLALKRWTDVLEAADALKKDAPNDPRMVEVDYARGRALQSLAKFDEARAAYQAVIDARKGGDLAARAQLMRGETYFHQKNYKEAILEFHRVDVLYDAPRWQAAALLEAGKVYERLAQWADAAETYERLRSKFPDDPSAAEAKTRLESARKHAEGQPAPPETASSNDR
jgi:TolA-binding protein